MNRRVLHLTLSKKWFDMIESGDKLTEYRAIKDYWCRRLLDFQVEMEYGAWREMIDDLNDPRRHGNDHSEVLRYFGVGFRKYDAVKFVNGYGADRPNMIFEIESIKIGDGLIGWGAEPGVNYFRIGLGRRLNPEHREEGE